VARAFQLTPVLLGQTSKSVNNPFITA